MRFPDARKRRRRRDPRVVHERRASPTPSVVASAAPTPGVPDQVPRRSRDRSGPRGRTSSTAAPEPASEGSGAGTTAGGSAEGRGPDRIVQLEEALAERVGPLEVQRVDFVGPKVGAELREDGLRALAIACLLILVYIGFRFSPRFAPGAVVALIHDVLVTVVALGASGPGVRPAACSRPCSPSSATASTTPSSSTTGFARTWRSTPRATCRRC